MTEKTVCSPHPPPNASTIPQEFQVRMAVLRQRQAELEQQEQALKESLARSDKFLQAGAPLGWGCGGRGESAHHPAGKGCRANVTRAGHPGSGLVMSRWLAGGPAPGS